VPSIARFQLSNQNEFFLDHTITQNPRTPESSNAGYLYRIFPVADQYDGRLLQAEKINFCFLHYKQILPTNMCTWINSSSLPSYISEWEQSDTM